MIPYLLTAALAAAPATEPLPQYQHCLEQKGSNCASVLAAEAPAMYDKTTSRILQKLSSEESALDDFTIQGQILYLAAKVDGSGAEATEAIMLSLYQCDQERDELQQERTSITTLLTSLERKLEAAAPALKEDKKYSARKTVVWNWIQEQGLRLGPEWTMRQGPLSGQYCRIEGITDFLKERGLE